MKILIVHPFGIGDVIFSFPLIEVLKKHNHTIDFVCNERTAQLIRMNPSVTSAHIFNRDAFRAHFKQSFIKGVQSLIDFLKPIRQQKYDALIDLSLGREYGFWAMMVGIPKRMGLNYKKRGLFLTHHERLECYENKPVARYYLELLKYLDLSIPTHLELPKPRVSSQVVESFSNQHPSLTTTPYIIIAPGGGRSWGPYAAYKQWDEESFIQLGQKFLNNHPSMQVVILGSPDEAELCQRVTQSMNSPRTTCSTHLSLEEVILLMQHAKGFVGNDGGLYHMSIL